MDGNTCPMVRMLGHDPRNQRDLHLEELMREAISHHCINLG